MLRRFERLLIAAVVAVLAAGATLLIARAQDPTPAAPAQPGAAGARLCRLPHGIRQRMEGRAARPGSHRSGIP